MFQSPSLRGSGRLESGAISGRQALHVSIPFIAGQWSLMASVGRRAARAASFNPLHCGAVVAWGGKGATYEQHCRSFNPLHCGAVVAWASGARRRRRPAAACFNPLHCGAVVASRADPSGRRICSVSIPFIAGQWSLGRAMDDDIEIFVIAFQSPSLRGSGRFPSCRPSPSATSSPFQSPSLRGSGRLGLRRVRCVRRVAVFQSPSLRGSGRLSLTPRRLSRAFGGFNPLHCGAVVASPRTTPSSLFGVLLRKRRLPCDHIICTRLPF